MWLVSVIMFYVFWLLFHSFSDIQHETEFQMPKHTNIVTKTKELGIDMRY